MDNGILFLIVLVALVLLWRNGSSARQRPLYRERRSGYASNTPFHAVSIHADSQCCSAVRTVEARRFLSEDAPGLPLPQCDYATCRCKYEHHGDRRSGARDRRYTESIASEAAEFWSLKNRRSASGRRGEDLQTA